MIYNNKYRIIRPLGRGGQGEVYLVEDLHVNKLWAMKIIKQRAGIELEIQALRNLQHKYLPIIVDLVPLGEYMGIVMEYVKGETLEHYLKRKGAVPQAQAMTWAVELAEVLHYLHTRTPSYVYGDMKPANIMVAGDKGIKLIDLGTVMGEADRGQYQVVGTRGYMAPEKERDIRSDIYSLGMTIHSMVTGNNPGIPGYHLRPIREQNGTLSRGLEKIVERCLEKDPQLRYQTCSALIKDLENHEVLNGKYLWEYRITYGTYLLLSITGIGVMGMQLYRYAQIGRGNTGYLIYSMVCAVAAYLLKKFCLERKSATLHFYRQEISILKTERKVN